MLFMKRYTPDFYFSISKRRNASNKRPGVYLIFIQLLFSYIDITYKSMLPKLRVRDLVSHGALVMQEISPQSNEI